MADVTLTEDERAILNGGVRWWEEFGGDIEAIITPRVEAIVAARVAAALGEVEARLLGDHFAEVELGLGVGTHFTIAPHVARYLSHIVREVRGEVGG